MKSGPGALVTAENESGGSKHENVTRRPAVLPKTSPGALNIKTGPDALVTAKNESGRAKHENGTRHPPYRRKRVRTRKTLKRDPTPCGTTEK
jgi:hypothetical protein